jgi:hypothetical protein
LWQIIDLTATQTAEAAQLATWFIFINRIHIGNEEEFFINVNLPSFSDCISENNLSQIEKWIKYELKKGSSYILNDVLEQTLSEVFLALNDKFNCCECPLSLAISDMNLLELYEHGYYAYPITILNPSLTNNHDDKDLSRRSSSDCDVTNNATIEFSIGSINNCNIEANICAFVSEFPELSSKFYISDNNSYEDTFQDVVQTLNKKDHGYGFAGHFHIYDSPDDDNIPDLILFQDYSESDIAWCYDNENFDPQNTFYTPFQFAGELPILQGDNIPESPDFKFLDYLFWSVPDEYLIQTQALAHSWQIPEKDIHLYSYNQEFSPIGLIGDLLFPVPFIDNDWANLIQYNQAIILQHNSPYSFANEYEFSAYCNRDITFQAHSRYFVKAPEEVDGAYTTGGGYINIPSQNAYTSLAYTDDGEPIIDSRALDFRFEEPKQPYVILGLNPNNAIKFGKALIKGLPKNAVIKTNVGKSIYKITVNGQVYIGKTKNAISKRVIGHLNKFEKWEDLVPTEKMMEDLVNGVENVIHKIGTKAEYNGLEQIFIEAYDSIGKGLNKINAVNPKDKVNI